jgi:hypothetical protein
MGRVTTALVHVPARCMLVAAPEEVSGDVCCSRYTSVYLSSEGPTRDVTHRQSVTTVGGVAQLSGSDSWRGGGPS